MRCTGGEARLPLPHLHQPPLQAAQSLLGCLGLLGHVAPRPRGVEAAGTEEGGPERLGGLGRLSLGRRLGHATLQLRAKPALGVGCSDGRRGVGCVRVCGVWCVACGVWCVDYGVWGVWGVGWGWGGGPVACRGAARGTGGTHLAAKRSASCRMRSSSSLAGSKSSAASRAM